MSIQVATQRARFWRYSRDWALGQKYGCSTSSSCLRERPRVAVAAVGFLLLLPGPSWGYGENRFGVVLMRKERLGPSSSVRA